MSDEDDMQSKLAAIHREAEERDAQQRATTLGVPYVDIRKAPVSIEALPVIPEEDSLRMGLVAIERKDRLVALAAVHPTSKEVEARLTQLKSEGYTTKLYLASSAAVAEAQAFYKFVPKATEDITGDVKVGGPDQPASFQDLKDRLTQADYNSIQTTTLFQWIASGALASNASDIHLESKDAGGLLRLRVDGLLHDVFLIPAHAFRMLDNRIKLLSGLKLNVRSEAQDGRFTIDLVSGSTAEVRVSIIPSDNGEVIVMRVLDPESLAVDITNLGLRTDDEKLILGELNRPNGIVLNTGPTGSGKTTTLYSFLKHINAPEVKVITIEDPIEYKLPGIDQTQVDPEGGYTFASGLRSILRQDPDVILVGEIRDGETAETALQAALTGHLVFSTLHTNDAAGAIPRLIDLGVRPATIAPAVNVIIAQRLVRILCVCKQQKSWEPAMLEKLKTLLAGLPERVDKKPYEEALAKNVEFTPGSCDICNGFGYKGRKAIFEFLQVTTEVQNAIGKEVSELDIKEIAAKQGMVPMQYDGLLKAILGLTTVDEVVSVTGPIV